MSEWTCVIDHVPGLTRQWVNLIAPADLPGAEQTLREAGFELRVATGTVDRRETTALLCEALGLPAVRNLDAFADVLRDLAVPGGRLVLVWQDAGVLAAADLTGWLDLVEILGVASVEHATEHDDSTVVFETLAVVDGFGVQPVLGATSEVDR